MGFRPPGTEYYSAAGCPDRRRGAWFERVAQAVREMVGRTQDDAGRWNDPYARPIHGREVVSGLATKKG